MVSTARYRKLLILPPSLLLPTQRRLLRASLNLPHDQVKVPRKVLQPVDLPQEEIISRENQGLDMTTTVVATVVDMVGTVEEDMVVDVIMV